VKETAAKETTAKETVSGALPKEGVATEIIGNKPADSGKVEKEPALTDSIRNVIVANEAAARNAAYKEAIAKEAAAKETAAKEAAAKETATKEAAAKEAALKEAALKEAALKEATLKEAAAKETALKETASKETASKDIAVAGSQVRKLSEKHSDKEVMVTFTDKTIKGKTDTISIIIPVEQVVAPLKKDSGRVRYDPNPRPINDRPTLSRDTQVTSAGTNVSPGFNTGSPEKDSDNLAGPATRKAPVMINSDCVNFATEYDLDKLRVRMMAEVNAEDRISGAKKVFRTKCFTTRQVRALTELFLNDEGKYKFLDTAYPFVSDSQEFRKLVDVLKEDYYIKRFNAMIRL